jgi:O-antigen ligase
MLKKGTQTAGNVSFFARHATRTRHVDRTQHRAGKTMEMIAVIAAMAALVWGVVFFRKAGLLGGCLALLLAGCCFGYPFYVMPVRPIPITIDRLLWLTMVALFLVERGLGWIERKPLGMADWALVALVGWLAASTMTHDWQWLNYRPLAHLLFFYLMPVGLYWIAREAPLSDRSVAVTFAAMAVFGLYLAVTAVAEVTRQAWLVFPKYMTLPTELEFYGRGRGPMLNPIGNGFYQSVCLFAGLALWPRLGRWGRLALVALAVVLSAGIWCTATRSVWMGAAAGLMLMVLLAAPRTWRMPMLAATLVGGTLLAATQWDRLLAFKRDEYLSAEEAARSVELRPILAQVAWNMFLDRPLAGCGYGQYFNTYADYLSDRSVELPLERARPYCQHNVFLSLLVETGLVGTALFVALLGLWTRDAWRIWRRLDGPPWSRQLGLVFLAVMTAYACNAMFHEMSLIPTTNMLLLFMAGLVAGARVSPVHKETPSCAT